MKVDKVFWGGAMKGLFVKLYIASITSILGAVVATFFLLWCQWHPKNNHNHVRFQESAIHELIQEIRSILSHLFSPHRIQNMY